MFKVLNNNENNNVNFFKRLFEFNKLEKITNIYKRFYWNNQVRHFTNRKRKGNRMFVLQKILK